MQYPLVIIAALTAATMTAQGFQRDSIPNQGEPVLIIIPTLKSPALEAIHIYNAWNNERQASQGPGQVVTLNRGQTLTAQAAAEVTQVSFYIDGQLYQNESVRPFALAGDKSGNLANPNIDPGTYELKIELKTPEGPEIFTLKLTVK